MNSMKVLAMGVLAVAMLGAASNSQDVVPQGAMAAGSAVTADIVTSLSEAVVPETAGQAGADAADVTVEEEESAPNLSPGNVCCAGGYTCYQSPNGCPPLFEVVDCPCQPES